MDYGMSEVGASTHSPPVERENGAAAWPPAPARRLDPWTASSSNPWAAPWTPPDSRSSWPFGGGAGAGGSLSPLSESSPVNCLNSSSSDSFEDEVFSTQQLLHRYRALQKAYEELVELALVSGKGDCNCNNCPANRPCGSHTCTHAQTHCRGCTCQSMQQESTQPAAAGRRGEVSPTETPGSAGRHGGGVHGGGVAVSAGGGQFLCSPPQPPAGPAPAWPDTKVAVVGIETEDADMTNA